MSKRNYGQYCGLTRALEIIGERWALLIIRDLLVGPRRFTDLRRGLPNIPTNILTARLKELEEAGIVHRRLLPRPSGSVVYELTPYGSELEDSVLALGLWGARLLKEPRPDELVTVDSLIMALRTSFRPEAAHGVTLAFELRTGGHLVHLRISDGSLTAAAGPWPGADLVIEAGSALRALLAGEVGAAQALGDGSVRVAGDPALLTRFTEIFFVPPARTALQV
jgi:DNA-binding HxlR family transcriptional regulator/putative sterol carrier protein